MNQQFEFTGGFLDLPAEMCDRATALAEIIPVPYDRTSTYMKGADRGPGAIIAASAQVEWWDIPTNAQPCDEGIFTGEPLECDGTPEQLADLVEARVRASINNSHLPVVLGGEHSVTIGAVRAACETYPGTGILQIDAHADLREDYHGSPCNHACVMARARECGPITQVGIRSLSTEEAAHADHDRIFYAHDINAQRDESWMERVLAQLPEKVYVTIDLDGLDPSLLPATGTPEPGGLSWDAVNRLLGMVAQEREIVGFDVVELCPRPHDHASEFVAAKLVYRLFAEIVAARKAVHSRS